MYTRCLQSAKFHDAQVEKLRLSKEKIMKIMKKTAIAAVVALSASMTTYAEKVNIGDPGWTGATAIANLLSAVITDKMGGEVDLVPGNNTAIY